VITEAGWIGVTGAALDEEGQNQQSSTAIRISQRTTIDTRASIFCIRREKNIQPHPLLNKMSGPCWKGIVLYVIG